MTIKRTMNKTLYLLFAILAIQLSACSTYSKLAMTHDGLITEDYGERTKGTEVEDTTIEAKL